MTTTTGGPNPPPAHDWRAAVLAAAIPEGAEPPAAPPREKRRYRPREEPPAPPPVGPVDDFDAGLAALRRQAARLMQMIDDAGPNLRRAFALASMLTKAANEIEEQAGAQRAEVVRRIVVGDGLSLRKLAEREGISPARAGQLFSAAVKRANATTDAPASGAQEG